MSDEKIYIGSGEEHVFKDGGKVIEAPDVYCPVCFGYIGPNETKCPHCGAVLKKKHVIEPKKEKKLEGDLVEFKAVPLRDRPPEERKEKGKYNETHSITVDTWKPQR